MGYPAILLVLTGAAFTSAQSPVPVTEVHYTIGCFDSGAFRWDITMNGDEVSYVVLNKHETVWTIPHSQHLDEYDEVIVAGAELSRSHCLPFLDKVKGLIPYAPKSKVAPDSSVYSRNEVESNEENTLICLMDNFYPPSINVTWTRNNVKVTGGVAYTRYLLNKDGTFRYYSTLGILPSEGDIYACTVEHEALESPLTRMWDTKVNEPSADPTLFLGSCLALALLEVAVGSFLLVKDPGSRHTANSVH